MCVCVHVSTATERKEGNKRRDSCLTIKVFVWLPKACHLLCCINSLSGTTYFGAATRHGHSLTDECLS